MHRETWKKKFKKNMTTEWLCPHCHIGYLTSNNDSFIIEETSQSKNNHDREDFEPEWIENKFSCILRCNNIRCLDVVAVCGESFIEEKIYFEQGMDSPELEYHDVFSPKYIFPSPSIIVIPKSCPKSLSELIVSSYPLYWSDMAACANRIRLIIEELLTIYKIKRYRINRGRRYIISLNERIRLFQTKNNSIADSLLAIKWIGNEGSHSIKVTQDDLLDAYELLENSLSELFDNHSKRLDKIKKEIIKKKGPRSKKKSGK